MALTRKMTNLTISSFSLFEAPNRDSPLYILVRLQSLLTMVQNSALRIQIYFQKASTWRRSLTSPFEHAILLFSAHVDHEELAPYSSHSTNSRYQANVLPTTEFFENQVTRG